MGSKPRFVSMDNLLEGILMQLEHYISINLIWPPQLREIIKMTLVSLIFVIETHMLAVCIGG